MLLSLRKNGPTSLFKEVTGFSRQVSLPGAQMSILMQGVASSGWLGELVRILKTKERQQGTPRPRARIMEHICPSDFEMCRGFDLPAERQDCLADKATCFEPNSMSSPCLATPGRFKFEKR